MTQPTHISKGIGKIQRQQQPETLNEHSNSQSTAIVSDNERKKIKAEYLTLIANAENEQQIHLSEFERDALMEFFFAKGWTLEMVRKASGRLAYVDKYGKLAPESWVKALDEPLYMASELKGIIERTAAWQIAQNREAYRKLKEGGYKVPDEELMREGFLELRTMYEAEYLLQLRSFIDEQKERCNRARDFITTLERDAIDALYRELVDKELIQPIDAVTKRAIGEDRFIMGFIPRFSKVDGRLLGGNVEMYLRSRIVDIIDVVESYKTKTK